MNLQTLQERQDNLTAQRAQLLEEANRQLAMIDGALLLAAQAAIALTMLW